MTWSYKSCDLINVFSGICWVVDDTEELEEEEEDDDDDDVELRRDAGGDEDDCSELVVKDGGVNGTEVVKLAACCMLYTVFSSNFSSSWV